MIWDVDSYILMDKGWVRLPGDISDQPPFESDPSYRAAAKERFQKAYQKQHEKNKAYLEKVKARGTQSRP